MKSCWDVKSEFRPTFSQIVQTLEHQLAIFSDYIDLEGMKADNAKTDEKVEESGIHASPNEYCVAGM